MNPGCQLASADQDVLAVLVNLESHVHVAMGAITTSTIVTTSKTGRLSGVIHANRFARFARFARIA